MGTINFCDLHCDTAMEILAEESLNSTSTQVNIPMMKATNIILQLFACYLPSSIPPKYRSIIILRMLDRIEAEIDLNSDDIMICTDFSTTKHAMKINKIGAILTVENGMAIENKIKNLEMFFEKGVRCMTIVHAESHDWAISSADRNPDFDGLTNFGEKVISAMNELGMIVDVSHAHDNTVKKVLSITKKPIIASHSCVNTLCQSPRNLKDAIIKGIADSGGMIGINFFPGFLDSTYNQILDNRAGDLFIELGKMERKAGVDIVKISLMFHEFRQRLRKIMSDMKVSVDRIIDHVDYIIKLVGDDFVGFGSDFDGIPDFPDGIEDCRGFNLIKEKMIEKDYSQDTLEKICYKNFLRVFEHHQP